MKVLIIETLGDGGIAHYTFNIANSLVRKGANVSLFTSRSYEFRKEACQFRVYRHMFRVAHHLIRVFPSIDRETGFYCYLRRAIKLLEYPLNMIEALWIARRERSDVIHFQSVNETEILMIIPLVLMGFRVVFTVHNVMPRHGQLKFYHAVIYRTMYRLCNKIVIHTDSGKREIVRLFGIKPSKICVIPHGDYKFFLRERNLGKDEAKTLLGIPSRCKTILFFGAIRPNKGLDSMLFALSHIKREFPEIKLMVIGEPCEDYKKYRKIIEKKGIQDQVFEKLEYIGNQEVALYFSAADVVVLPYYEVTQSGVLHIAYAFGKPVVATSIGGFKEAVDSGKNGYLVPPKDIKALAAKITEILSDKGRMESMGAYSRFLCNEKYSWDSIATRTLVLYSSL